MNKLEESYQTYKQRRAQDKYDGMVEGFSSKEFRECADYLAAVLERAAFDEEDLGDMVRVAISKREGCPPPKTEARSRLLTV